eukprot:1143556-Pelagomonas_calceolata.AAC.4
MSKLLGLDALRTKRGSLHRFENTHITTDACHQAQRSRSGKQVAGSPPKKWMHQSTKLVATESHGASRVSCHFSENCESLLLRRDVSSTNSGKAMPEDQKLSPIQRGLYMQSQACLQAPWPRLPLSELKRSVGFFLERGT